MSCFTRLSLRGQDCSRTGNVIHTTRYEPESYRANDKCAEAIHCGKNLEGLGVTDAVPFFAPRTFETLLSAKSSSTTTTRLEQLISGSQLVIFNKFFGKKWCSPLAPPTASRAHTGLGFDEFRGTSSHTVLSTLLQHQRGHRIFENDNCAYKESRYQSARKSDLG